MFNTMFYAIIISNLKLNHWQVFENETYYLLRRTKT